MSTPNPNGKSTTDLTPEQAAELNRMRAAKRQADRRRRDREMAAEEARVFAEAVAERAALEAARTERMADLEKRLVDMAETARQSQERLEDAITLLAIHHDMSAYDGHIAASDANAIRKVNEGVVTTFNRMTARYWTCTGSEALVRAQGLLTAVKDRIGTLTPTNGPLTVRPRVTPPDTPVTGTVRNADRPERIADRSHETPPISDEEQAWIDKQGQSPYDEYEARVAHIEALAEGSAEDDDEDDGERF